MSPMAMSATRPRRFRCSASASRFGRSTPCSSPITPATANGPATWGRPGPAADVVTPNQFELDLLAGQTTATLRDLRAAVDAVHKLGPSAILVTSLHTDT